LSLDKKGPVRHIHGGRSIRSGSSTIDLTATGCRMLPGGYTFVHAVFWFVVLLVAVGTNLIPILLSLGLGILLLESRGKA